jgi:Family of unknown function (DUF6193)
MYVEVSKMLDEQLYPDLAASGGFAAAFQVELRRVGSSLTIAEDDSLPMLWPSISHDDRSCQVLLAAHQRSFSVSSWHRGVEYGRGWTPELNGLAGLFLGFLERRAALGILESTFPWFRATEGGRLHERSPALYVENRWRQYELSQPDNALFQRLYHLISEAGKHRALRQLLPFTSLEYLCFSRTTGYPFASKDCPYAFPLDDGCYRVVAPSGKAPAAKESDRIVGEGDAAQAAAWLAGMIPQGWGPARDGTEADSP